MLKQMLGLAPQPTDDGAYIPSPMALKMATADQTNYDGTEYPDAHTGEPLKILVLCTEDGQLEMDNGKRFATGNHPVELLVPMLHWQRAGFQLDIYTPTGQRAQLETWAMPTADQPVMACYAYYQSQLEQPRSLADFVSNEMETSTDYVAVFIPGGHGALLNLPDNDDVAQLLHWAHRKDYYMLSICHGPAAFLAARPDEENGSFIYAGYEIAAFPDMMDRITPYMGYMPGQLKWHFGKALEEMGMTIVNSAADATCHQDRKLITGASPLAANDFGKMAARELLRAVQQPA